MEYHQNASDSCYFSSLAYVFTASGENNATRGIVMKTEVLLQGWSKGYRDMISFDNFIMKDQSNNSGGQYLYYNINKWKTQGTF